VRFFQALRAKPSTHSEDVPVLTAKETEMDRSLFRSTAAPCLKCHATGDLESRSLPTPQFPAARGRFEADWMETLDHRPQLSLRGPSMRTLVFSSATLAPSQNWVIDGPRGAASQLGNEAVTVSARCESWNFRQSSAENQHDFKCAWQSSACNMSNCWTRRPSRTATAPD